MENISKLSDRDFRKWLSNRLVVDKPLEPDDPLYEPLYDGVAGDPVDLLFEDIDLSQVESLNFISGFRGSGKTTELFRLRKRLRQQGYFVAYANALDYLLPSEPVDISDFLLVLAGSFSEAIEQTIGIDPAKEGFWTRFVNFLTKTNVTLDGFDVEAKIPSTDVGLNFKTSLKQVPSFRQHLREKLTARLGELRREVREFFAFGRKRIKEAEGDCGVVFIFDQLEQLRDTLDSGGRVGESVAMLIANHRDDLRMPLLHTVYTVPPWLKFKLPELRKIRLLYNVKLWKNNEKRTRVTDGWKIMRGVIQRRFTPDGMRRFFGQPTKGGSFTQADTMIEASGGHFRDLLVLLREALLRSRVLPITPDIADSAIANLRASYLPLSRADAQYLREIGRKRRRPSNDLTSDDAQRLTFLLDNHLVLVPRNSKERYAVHPLIRDAVMAKRVVKYVA